MAANKTVATDASVDAFIDSVTDEVKRGDARELAALMSGITGHPACLWGSALVGFGRYRYRYASGRQGEFFLTGFSPRKSAIAIYIMPGFEHYGDLLEALGPHKTGKSCLYVKRLDAIDREVLARLIEDSVARMRDRYDVS